MIKILHVLVAAQRRNFFDVFLFKEEQALCFTHSFAENIFIYSISRFLLKQPAQMPFTHIKLFRKITDSELLTVMLIHIGNQQTEVLTGCVSLQTVYLAVLKDFLLQQCKDHREHLTADRSDMWESILDSYVESGMDREESWKESLKTFIPLERGDQKAEDIAYTVAFLCSEYANHITGQSINVDGGAAMN